MSFLPDAETYRRLIDGTTSGSLATVAKSCLATASLPYGAAVGLRNCLYDRGWLPVTTPPIPVISIGNLTLGGTGKSPLVGWVASALHSVGMRPVIVSRGYKARGTSCVARSRASDEGREFAITHPHITHLAHPRRFVAVLEAAKDHAATVAILDDGFQHRRLSRELDIVAVDATDPLGGGLIFPRGLLREPADSLRRADCVVLTRCDRVPEGEPSRIRRSLENACGGLSHVLWAESRHFPTGLRLADGSVEPLSSIAGRRVLAMCGIGNPRQFRTGLQSLGATVTDHVEFPDHHAYSSKDAALIRERARHSGSEWIVTTVKDLVKIEPSLIPDIPVAAVEVRLQFLAGEDGLLGRLRESVTGRSE